MSSQVIRYKPHTPDNTLDFTPPSNFVTTPPRAPGFPVHLHIDTFGWHGSYATWTTILWEWDWTYADFREAIQGTVLRYLRHDRSAEDHQYLGMQMIIWQCKVTYRAMITMLDEIIDFNYAPVQSRKTVGAVMQ